MLAEPMAEPGPGMGPSHGAQQRLCLSQITCTPSLLFPVWALQPGVDGGLSPGTPAASHRPQTKTEAAHRAHRKAPLSHRGSEGSGRGHRVSEKDRAVRDRDGERHERRGQRGREVHRPTKEKHRDAKRGRDRKGPEVGTDLRASPSHTHTHPHAPHPRPLGRLEPHSGSLRPSHVLWG